METSSPTAWLTAEEIEIPLRQFAGPEACLSGEWSLEQFKIGQGDGLGVWRVAGAFNDSSTTREWSMVLKGWLCTDTTGSPSHFNWPWREAELYRSGLLNDLPGVCAPTCFHSIERDDSVWVWLEDLTTIPQEPWNLERYATAARLLGRFNGAYLTCTPLPQHRSLSRNWLAGWVADGAAGIAMIDHYRDHPAVQKTLPPDVLDALLRVWSRRQHVLDLLEQMPQTFCHLDAFHQNTFFRDRDGEEEMVLIDWSFAGRAAVGEELAALCVAGVIFNPLSQERIEAIEDVAFQAYTGGLRDSGWNANTDTLWQTYRNAALLRYGPAPLTRMLPILTNEAYAAAMAEAMGVSVEALFEHLAKLYRWFADQADEI